MALSGSFETTSSHGRCLAFSFTATQDKVKATSKINYKLVGAGTAGGYVVSGNFKLVIDGQTVYSSAERIHLEKGTVVAQGSVTLTHDDKGERSFAVSAQAGIYDAAVNCRGSKTFTLNPIPRVSSVKGEYAWQYIGKPIKLIISRNADEFTHKLFYEFKSSGKTLIASGVGGEYVWNIPTSLYALIPNEQMSEAKITCETYSGGTFIGSSETPLRIWCEEAVCRPSITFNSLEEMYQPLKELALGENVFVWRASEIKASYSGVNIKNSAKFAYVELAIGDLVPDTKNPADTSIILPRFVNNPLLDRIDIPGGEYNAVLTVYDSRGFSFSQTKKVSMLPYSNPKILCDVGRINNFESETEVVPGGEISVFKGESGAVSFKYAVASPGQTPEAFTEFNKRFEGGKISGDKVTLDLDNTKEWDVHIVLSDGMSAPQTRVYRVFRGVPLMFIDADTGDLEIMGKLKSKGLDCKKEILTLNGYTVNVARSGNTVQVHTQGRMNQVSDIPAWGSYRLFTLPEGYRPIMEIEAPLVSDGRNAEKDWLNNNHLWVGPEGAVRIRTRNNPISGWSAFGDGFGLWVSLTFITADNFPADTVG